MQEIGRIALIQVQRNSLKVGRRPQAYYDPTPLLAVDHLLISAKGVIGVTADGRQVIDVHHIDHPASRNDSGQNGISVGFSSHYRAMQERFGAHMVEGVAGENILVEAQPRFHLPNSHSRLVIQTAATGQLVYLQNLKVAEPCVEFSHFAANASMPLPAQKLKETLQFLSEGQRGFYATLANEQEAMVRVGDRMFVDEAGALI